MMDTPRVQCDICRRWTVNPSDGLLAVLCLDCRVDLELEIERILEALEPHEQE